MQPGETRRLPSPAEQLALGASLAGQWGAGQLIFLEGELGAGKTTLTQGLLQALGFAGPVTSPTYALMQLYPAAAGQVLHIDAYRVRDPAELYEMDLDDLIASSRLSIMEWGEKFYADYPAAPIYRLEHLDGQEGRQVTRLR